MTTRLLIEGRPGAGKTTAARRLVGILRERGVPVRGTSLNQAQRQKRALAEKEHGGMRDGFVLARPS